MYDSTKSTQTIAEELFNDSDFYYKLGQCCRSLLENFDNINKVLTLLCEYNIPSDLHMEILSHFNKLFHKKYNELGMIQVVDGVEYIEIPHEDRYLRYCPKLFNFI